MSEKLKETWRMACEAYGQRVPLNLAVWTTTAWSLPGNAVRAHLSPTMHLMVHQGVAVDNEMQYVIVVSTKGRFLIICTDRLDTLREIIGDLRVVGQLSGKTK